MPITVNLQRRTKETHMCPKGYSSPLKPKGNIFWKRFIEVVWNNKSSFSQPYRTKQLGWCMTKTERRKNSQQP